MDLQEIRKIYFECLCWQPNLMIDFLETKRKSMNYSLDLFYKPLLQFHHDDLRNNEKLAKEKNTFIDENGVLHSSTRVIYYNGFYQNIEILKDFKKIISDFLEEKMKAGINPAASTSAPKPKAKRTTASERYPTFESMFRDKTKAAKVLELLQKDETYYKPISKILAITEVLATRNILNKAVPTGYRNTLFAKELHITIKGRTTTQKRKFHDEDFSTFDELFSKL